jgi:hypothetical protein
MRVAEKHYTKRAKELVTTEEVVSMIRSHANKVYRAMVLRVAVGVFIWTAAIVFALIMILRR